MLLVEFIGVRYMQGEGILDIDGRRLPALQSYGPRSPAWQQVASSSENIVSSYRAVYVYLRSCLEDSKPVSDAILDATKLSYSIRGKPVPVNLKVTTSARLFYLNVLQPIRRHTQVADEEAAGAAEAAEDTSAAEAATQEAAVEDDDVAGRLAGRGGVAGTKRKRGGGN